MKILMIKRNNRQTVCHQAIEVFCGHLRLYTASPISYNVTVLMEQGLQSKSLRAARGGDTAACADGFALNAEIKYSDLAGGGGAFPAVPTID